MRTYTAVKFVRSGHGDIKTRLHVKAFKNGNGLGAFLCRQSDNSWQECSAEKQDAQKYPVKTGVYAFAGGQWHNVKNLDPSILAHV